MRIISMLVAMAFTVLALTSCSMYKADDKNKVEMRKGTKAECNRLDADIERLKKIEPDLTKDEWYAECLKIQEGHLGLICTFTKDIRDGRGGRTTETYDVEVNKNYCDVKI